MVLQVEFRLPCPGVVEFVRRRAVELLSAPGEFQWVSALAIGRKELPGRLACAVKLAGLGDDDRPTKNGENDQRADGHLPFGRGLLEREAQCAAGQER